MTVASNRFRSAHSRVSGNQNTSWVSAFAGTSGLSCEATRAYAAIASSRRLVTGGPNTPMTTKTIVIAPAMKLNTPIVP